MPILLAEIGGWFAIGFLLISFIGWIINLINAQNPPPAPNRGPRRPPQARDRKVQNEIELFLQEAMGEKRDRPNEVRAEDIEVLEPAPRPKRRPPSQPRQRPPARESNRPKRAPVADKPPIAQKPGSGVASRHMSPSPGLGGSVTSHVAEHMGNRVRQEAEQHLPHAVDQTVTQHLGEFTADDRDTRATVKPVRRSRANIPDPAGLMADLRNPLGMRKAILLQEILSKPRILRR